MQSDFTKHYLFVVKITHIHMKTWCRDYSLGKSCPPPVMKNGDHPSLLKANKTLIRSAHTDISNLTALRMKANSIRLAQ